MPAPTAGGAAGGAAGSAACGSKTTICPPAPNAAAVRACTLADSRRAFAFNASERAAKRATSSKNRGGLCSIRLLSDWKTASSESRAASACTCALRVPIEGAPKAEAAFAKVSCAAAISE